jgi:hypothetical protein
MILCLLATLLPFRYLLPHPSETVGFEVSSAFISTRSTRCSMTTSADKSVDESLVGLDASIYPRRCKVHTVA